MTNTGNGASSKHNLISKLGPLRLPPLVPYGLVSGSLYCNLSSSTNPRYFNTQGFLAKHSYPLMALRQALPPLINFASPWSAAVNPTFRSRAVFNHSQYIARSWRLKVSGIAPICITFNIPSFLADIWEAVLRAVPKKKTSHRKKRQRFMAGKALKDLTSLNKCSACGNVKRAHLLCPYCVTGMCWEYF